MLDASLIFDGTLNPSTGVAVTATRQSTNVLDLLVGRDLGVGAILGIHVHVLEAFATLTSLTVSLEVCDTAGGTYLTLMASGAIPAAQLIAGSVIFRMDVPPNQVLNAIAGILKTPGRFLALRYTVAGANATTGKVFSYLTPTLDRQAYNSYPAGYAVAIAPGEL